MNLFVCLWFLFNSPILIATAVLLIPILLFLVALIIVIRLFLEKKNELNIITDNINDSLILLNKKLSIQKINPMTANLFERKQSDLVGLSIADLIPNQDFLELCQKKIQTRDNTESIDLLLAKKESPLFKNQDLFDQDPIPLQISASSFKSPRGNIKLLLIIKNLTSIKRHQLIQTDFISNLSHEIRTPITSISGYAEILLNDQLEGKKRKQFLQRIYRNSVRLTEITNDILTLSKIEAQGSKELQKEDCYPELVLKRAVDSVRRDHPDFEFSFSLHQEGNPIVLKANGGLLMMVFVNLIENAIRYKSPNRKCAIEAEIHYPNPTYKNKKRITFKIKDNGIGITQENISRVFERFYRSDRARLIHQKGTGLGLAIVKYTVKAHKGKVWIESDGKTETTFIIEIPLS